MTTTGPQTRRSLVDMSGIIGFNLPGRNEWTRKDYKNVDNQDKYRIYYFHLSPPLMGTSAPPRDDQLWFSRGQSFVRGIGATYTRWDLIRTHSLSLCRLLRFDENQPRAVRNDITRAYRSGTRAIPMPIYIILYFEVLAGTLSSDVQGGRARGCTVGGAAKYTRFERSLCLAHAAGYGVYIKRTRVDTHTRAVIF